MSDFPGDEGILGDAHHVNVQQAEDIFSELSRQLSGRSVRDDLNRPSSSRSVDKHEDLEKLGADTEERFDLREYLQSSNDAYQSAGIKHKHVGVTWEDLTVEVIGGADSKVRKKFNRNRNSLRIHFTSVDLRWYFRRCVSCKCVAWFCACLRRS